jgi:hypothetical protein
MLPTGGVAEWTTEKQTLAQMSFTLYVFGAAFAIEPIGIASLTR